MWKQAKWSVVLFLGFFFLGVCSPEVDEPELVLLEVVSVAIDNKAEVTDTGWILELATFELAIRDLEFTIEGETHGQWLDRLRDAIVNTAYAHPGHLAGGDVTGELRGNFLIDPLAAGGDPLGQAQLLVGDYNGMNFTFRTATVEDGLEKNSPLVNHTAFISGTAKRSEESISFRAIVDVEDGTQMVGAAFDMALAADADATLGFRILPRDPVKLTHLFDGIDFGALLGSGGGTVTIEPGDEAHNRIMKALVKHDHYRIDLL